MKSQKSQEKNPWPVPEWLEEKLRKSIPNLPMQSRFTDEAFDVLGQMIDDATRDFRNSAARNQLDVLATPNHADDLAAAFHARFGMNAADFALLAFEMVRSCAYAGFFGLYLDLWLLDEAMLTSSVRQRPRA